MKVRVLHCTAGKHDYDAPIKRGRTPKDCPKHKPVMEVVNKGASVDGNSGSSDKEKICTRCQQPFVIEQKGRGSGAIKKCADCRAGNTEESAATVKYDAEDARAAREAAEARGLEICINLEEKLKAAGVHISQHRSDEF